MISVLDLKPEIKLMRDHLDAACRRVLDHGKFIMGPEVKELEQQVAEYLGVKHAIGVNSGTDALLIALRAAGVGEGDEVITTTFTFFATAESIEMVGARPVFVDIEPDDYNINPEKIEAAITPKTKAIVPVHLFGKTAAMARIMEIAEKHNLLVVEDCAQSFGAEYRNGAVRADSKQLTVDDATAGETPAPSNPAFKKSSDWQKKLDGKKSGTCGIAGAFSFFPSKNLGGFGDGGMITTDDDEVAAHAAMLRVHGTKQKYHNEVLGYNSRLDTLQAALLQVKLLYIDDFNHRRRAVAHRYSEGLSDLKGIIPPLLPDEGHVYHQFTIQVTGMNRDDFATKLKEGGVQTMIYYPVPVHQLPIYQDMSLSLHVAEQIKNTVISLPMGPFLSEDDQEKVIKLIRAIVENKPIDFP